MNKEPKAQFFSNLFSWSCEVANMEGLVGKGREAERGFPEQEIQPLLTIKVEFIHGLLINKWNQREGKKAWQPHLS